MSASPYDSCDCLIFKITETPSSVLLTRPADRAAHLSSHSFAL